MKHLFFHLSLWDAYFMIKLHNPLKYRKMKKYIKFVVPVFFIVFISCGSSKKTGSTDTWILNKLITEQAFEIESRWAQPMATGAYSQAVNGLLPPGSTAGQINLIGNTNYLKMEKDSLSAYLPYFGERQMGGNYGATKGGIEFKGIPEDLEITSTDKSGYNIRFSINDKENKSENYKVYIQVYPDLNANVVINSSQRLSIRYRGVAMPLQK